MIVHFCIIFFYSQFAEALVLVSLIELNQNLQTSISAHMIAQFVLMELTLDWTGVNTIVIVSRGAVEKHKLHQK